MGEYGNADGADLVVSQTEFKKHNTRTERGCNRGRGGCLSLE